MAPAVSALVPAAGASLRMGTAKALLPLGDLPVIRHCVGNLVRAGIEDIVVVIGSDGEQVRKALDGTKARFALNDLPGSQMADSVRIGLKVLREDARAVLILPADHPLVLPETIRTILAVHQEETEKIIIPVHNGRRGHPALFPRAIAEEIMHEETLRAVVRKDPARVRTVEVSDDATLLDMDTPEDYRRIMKRFARGDNESS